MLDQVGLLLHFDEKRIVTPGRIELCVCRLYPGPFAGPGDLLGLVGRIEPVRFEGNDEKPRLDAPKNLRKPFPICQVEVVDCLRNVKVRVRVEATDEVVAPILQVALDFEFGVEFEVDLACS